MPKSVIYPNPFFVMSSSAVCTCVCVPNNTVAFPSRKYFIAIFSAVASAPSTLTAVTVSFKEPREIYEAINHKKALLSWI